MRFRKLDSPIAAKKKLKKRYLVMFYIDSLERNKVKMLHWKPLKFYIFNLY